MKAKAIILDPTTSTQVPVGAFFIDSDNANNFTLKSTDGSNQTVAKAGLSSFIKKMVANGSIPINTPVSKSSTGYVIPAVTVGANGSNVIGYALSEASQQGDLIDVLMNGPNMPGVLSGLGFATGDTIYLADNSGYTNIKPVFQDKSVIKLGIADCVGGSTFTVATDLIAITELIIK